MARPLPAVVFALTVASLAAQTQPTFRSGAFYVRVDMYASRDGKPIEDLKRDEVEVLEDGTLQTLEAFEHVRVRTLNPQDARVEPDSISDSRRMASDPRARVFVIFLDTYHTRIEGSATMRQPLINFLDRVLGPDDMVAVMTPEMGASDIAFGRRTTVISNILQREWMWGRRGRLVDQDAREEEYEACYPSLGDTAGIAEEMKARRREKLTLDAIEDLMVHLAGVREERKAILTVSEGWRLFTPNPQLARSVGSGGLPPGDVLGRPPRPQPTETGMVRGSMRQGCESDRMALAQMDDSLRLRQLTQQANRGNVTFYPIYAAGLVPTDASIGERQTGSLAQDSANLTARQNTLRELADDTDGVSVINTNNIDRMMQRIVDDLSSYYLMGYYATNTKLDGRFRSISVRVKRPGVMVRARKGYRGYTTEEISRGIPASAPTAAASAVSSALVPVVSVSARAQLRIRAAAQPSGATSAEGAVVVVGELDPQVRKQPAWTTGVQADVTVIGADGQQVASRRIDVTPATGAFSAQVPESGGVAPGEYTVRVRLRSPVDGELGLSDTTHVVVKEGTALGEAILWRRGPSTGVQYVRTADPRFQRNDRLRLELPTRAAGPATARIVDRTGTPTAIPATVTERQDLTSGVTWIVVDVPLAPFAPGDYAVDVTQGGASQLTAFRVVP